MKLLDLIADHGLIASDVASRAGIRPLLLQRLDVGIQPVTPSIAAALAFAIGTDPVTVRACCPLKTRLDGPRFRIPFPVQPGELQEAARLAPMQLRASNPSGLQISSLALFLAHTTNVINDSSIGEQWILSSDGRSLIKGGSIIDSNVGEGDARGIGFGLYGEPNVLWFGADDVSFNVMRLRVNPTTFAILDVTPTSVAFNGQAANAVKNPATGEVWFTSGQAELYRWQPGDSLPSTAAFSPLAPFDSNHKYKSLWFGSDGFLYALLSRSTGAINHGVARIDVTGTPSMAAAPALLFTGTAVRPVEFIPAAGKLFVTDPGAGGTNTTLVEWNPSDLTFATHTVSNRLLFTGSYDPLTDRLIYGGGNATLTQWGPVRVTRAGAVDWATGSMGPGTTAGLCGTALNVDARRFAMAGLLSSKNTLGYYDADTGEELALVSVGTGPNPQGQNLPPVGMMFT